jgi:HSP20 family protein
MQQEVTTMTAHDTQELKIREKQELSTPAEQTRPGLVFTPSVDIFETDKELVLLADMPGVRAEDLSIDLRDDMLTLAGDVQPGQGHDESDILIEYEMGKYYRQFSLSEIIDQARIDAKLEDGVLRLTLPKVEKATPRRIAVQSV